MQFFVYRVTIQQSYLDYEFLTAVLMNTEHVETTDILLVGAGPIGIEMAIMLKRNGFSYLHVEAGVLGQTISWYAPGTQFFSSPDRIAIASHPLQTPTQQKATAEQYLDYLRSVVAYHELPIHTFHQVTAIDAEESGEYRVTVHIDRSPKPADFLWTIPEKSSADKVIRCKKIILAVGDMHAPKALQIEGEALHHVSHYLQAPHRYYGQDVLIVGGKNSAVEAAIRLHRAGAHVTISYRGAAFDDGRVKYWLLPELLHLIKKEHIQFIPQSTPQQITRDHVVLRTPDGTINHCCEQVLLLTGYQQSKRLFDMAGIPLKGERKQPVHSLETMESAVPGIFIAGTAAAGTQLGGVRYFIENCHHHVDRIEAALTGSPPPPLEEAANQGFLEN